MSSESKPKLWAVRDERGTFLCWGKLPPPRVNNYFLIDDEFSINMGDPPGKAEFPVGSVVQITSLQTGIVHKARHHQFRPATELYEMPFAVAMEFQQGTGELMTADGVVLNSVVSEVLAMWLMDHPNEELLRFPDPAWWKQILEFARTFDD
jgi:hypothetical protein